VEWMDVVGDDDDELTLTVFSWDEPSS